MSALLLIVIYITFIGLGIPDSLFGAAWPAIYAELSLPISWASFITLTVSGGTILASLLSARLIRRWGTGRVTAVSTILTVFALFGFSRAARFFFLWLMAIPLGLGAGAIDTALNNYAALHYKASHMSFLHCFYGIGVSCSPLLMSLALADNANWRGGYQTVCLLQLSIAALTVAALPIWRRVGATAEEAETASVLLRSLLNVPTLYMVAPVFIGSCAIEYTCGSWGSSYLVGAKGFPADRAAAALALFYLGMTLGRFLSGLLAARVSVQRLILAGQLTVAAALVLLLLPLPPAVSSAALFLIGLGDGPVIPNMLYLTPTHFGRDASRAAMGLQMVFSYIGTLCAPALFGLAAQALGVSAFPVYLTLLYAVTLSGTLLLRAAPHR